MPSIYVPSKAVDQQRAVAKGPLAQGEPFLALPLSREAQGVPGGHSHPAMSTDWHLSVYNWIDYFGSNRKRIPHKSWNGALATPSAKFVLSCVACRGPSLQVLILGLELRLT